MLFVLTGQVQTGKTRWLEGLVRDLEDAGVTPHGVIAPGVWVDYGDNLDENGFEKLGIDNVLLPQGVRIAFARRADLAERDNTLDPNSQSSRAKLHWAISDDAIERVNGHFAALREQAATGSASQGFIIIDELGQLELIRGGGLTEAVALLQDGPSPLASHALVVIREGLLPHLEGKFTRWGKPVLVGPDGESHERILSELR